VGFAGWLGWTAEVAACVGCAVGLPVGCGFFDGVGVDAALVDGVADALGLFPGCGIPAQYWSRVFPDAVAAASSDLYAVEPWFAASCEADPANAWQSPNAAGPVAFGPTGVDVADTGAPLGEGAPDSLGDATALGLDDGVAEGEAVCLLPRGFCRPWALA
jgi:hypothetical protein